MPLDGNLADAAKETLAGGAKILVTYSPGDQLLAIADLPEAEDALPFNVSAEDDRLCNHLLSDDFKVAALKGEGSRSAPGISKCTRPSSWSPRTSWTPAHPKDEFLHQRSAAGPVDWTSPGRWTEVFRRIRQGIWGFRFIA